MKWQFKYLLFVLCLSSLDSRAASVSDSEKISFINWFVTDYLKPNHMVVSKYVHTIGESAIKDYSQNQILEEMRRARIAQFKEVHRDDTNIEMLSVVCVRFLTYKQSSIQVLQNLEPNIDTSFILEQIRTPSFLLLERQQFDKHTIKVRGSFLDRSFRRPLLLTPIKDVFGYRTVARIHQPVFSKDRQYVIIENNILSRQNKGSSNQILVFKHNGYSWDLASTIEGG